jgi:pimeloyl-ACP methyl ester carboxylesterase
VAACLETNVKAPCVLGGISMGAAIALHLAVHRPDLVKALVLARPAWLINAAPENMSPNAEVGALLKSNPPAEARRTFDASATADILARQAPDNLASLRSFFNRTPQADTAHLLTQAYPPTTCASLRFRCSSSPPRRMSFTPWPTPTACTNCCPMPGALP